MEIACFIGIAAPLVALRHVEARQVAAGRGQGVWLVFLPTLLAGAALVIVAVGAAVTTPLIGVPLAVVGGIVLAAMVRSIARMSRQVSATAPNDDITAALTEPLADLYLLWGAVLVLGSLVGVVGLIIWGLVQAIR